MKRSIVILILACVFLVDCGYGNNGFPSGVNNLPQELIDMLRSQSNQVKVLYEDFDGEFDLKWDVLGFDPKYISLNKVPGSLTLTTKSGSFEYSNDDYRNVFLIDFPVDQSVDFQVTTCISNFKPSDKWNQAGLLLWNDKDNFFKLSYEFGEETSNGENGLLFSAGRETGGSPSYTWFLADQFPQKMWLRIIKKKQVYVLYNSLDGQNFNPLQIYRSNSGIRDNSIPVLDKPLKSIGIFTSNYTNDDAPDVDASFDFFEFKVLSSGGTELPDYPVI